MNTRNALWINNQRLVPPESEFVEWIMKADSNGNLYVPTAWRGQSWVNYGSPFDRKIYVDWVLSATISGNSSRQWYRTVATGLEPNSNHNLKILPNNVDSAWIPQYGRLRWLWMGGDCNGWYPLTYKNPISDYLY